MVFLGEEVFDGPAGEGGLRLVLDGVAVGVGMVVGFFDEEPVPLIAAHLGVNEFVGTAHLAAFQVDDGEAAGEGVGVRDVTRNGTI